MRRRTAAVVGAALVAACAAVAAYVLWPSGGTRAGCATPEVPAAARTALAAYAGRVEHSVQHSSDGTREETWSDPRTGRYRQVSYDDRGRIAEDFAARDVGRFELATWVSYDDRTVESDRARRPAGAAADDGAAARALSYRVLAARGAARVVGRSSTTVHLRQTLHPPAPTLPPSAGLPGPSALRIDTWVDAVTYLPVRSRVTQRGQTSLTVESWLPRTAANVARTALVVPAGFRRLRPGRGTALEYVGSDSAVSRCQP
jgi:hypothetical protein